ncbi:MAG: 6-phosphofructokinase [Limisphaerales bacterium]
MKLFISYHLHQRNENHHTSDEAFAERVAAYLRKQTSLTVYFFSTDQSPNNWAGQVSPKLNDAEVFVLFAGKEFGPVQRREADIAWGRHLDGEMSGQNKLNLLVVGVVEEIRWPIDPQCQGWANGFAAIHPIRYMPTHLSQPDRVDESSAQKAAHEICIRLGKGENWRFDFEIPYDYPFAYEKDIIKEFKNGEGRLPASRRAEGCPEFWPTVPLRNAFFSDSRPDRFYDNPVPPHLIGKFSSEQSHLLVDVRDVDREPAPAGKDHSILSFNEARPRQRLRLPDPDYETVAVKGNALRVGIIVSGGIAPGINSVISGIVERHRLYQEHYAQKFGGPDSIGYSLEILGYRNGFRSIGAKPPQSIPLATDNMKRLVRDMANRGGSLLGTSRLDSLLSAVDPLIRAKAFGDMIDNLKTASIDILYVIGGDGSMRAAHALQIAAREAHYSLTVVGIPKTMDNDILWVWQSFGFLSAVEKAKEFITQLHTEARSNPRLCVMQLFGSDSGFVVSHAGLASGVVDLALIPEIGFSMRKVADYIKLKLFGQLRRGASPYGLVLMSETAIPTDVEELMEADRRRHPKKKVLRLEQEEEEEILKYIGNKRRVRGQTPDALRTGGLKIVSRILQHEIKRMEPRSYWTDYRVFTNEPRHLLRSLEPSSSDIIFGHRLGCLAVDNAIAGFTDFMVSQWLTEFALVPLRLVSLGRKRVPGEGIFWRSVLDSTGQDEDMSGGGAPLAFLTDAD